MPLTSDGPAGSPQALTSFVPMITTSFLPITYSNFAQIIYCCARYTYIISKGLFSLHKSLLKYTTHMVPVNTFPHKYTLSTYIEKLFVYRRTL